MSLPPAATVEGTLDRGLGARLHGQAVEATGVLHFGGHHGEEASYYERHGVRTVVWFEADPDAFEVLLSTVGGRPGHHCVQALVADRDGEERPFYRHRFRGGAKRGFCSTLPWNAPVVQGDPVLSRLENFEVRSMRTVTAARALRERGFAPSQFQYVSVNVQGAELMVLRGMGEYLEAVRWVFCDGERDEATLRYRGAPTIAEVGAWLAERGFSPAWPPGRQQLFHRREGGALQGP